MEGQEREVTARHERGPNARIFQHPLGAGERRTSAGREAEASRQHGPGCRPCQTASVPGVVEELVLFSEAQGPEVRRPSRELADAEVPAEGVEVQRSSRELVDARLPEEGAEAAALSVPPQTH